MAWIDYKKAYDMAPHSWILESISLAGWNSCKISRLLKNSMANWKTELTAAGVKLGKLYVNQGYSKEIRYHRYCSLSL